MNLHIFLSSIESETRLFKETQYTIQEGVFDRIGVCGLWREGLETFELLSWGLEVYRKKTYLSSHRDWLLSPKAKFLRKLFAMFSLIQYAIFILQKSLKFRPTHITCHNSMLLPLSWLAAKFSGALLIYTPHELETERTHLKGLQKRIEKVSERVFISSCAEVVVVCEPIAKWYVTRYKLKNVWTIRNLPKTLDVSIKNKDRNLLRKIFKIPADSLVVIYQGIFGPARGTSELLKIFSSVECREIHLVLMGLGDESDVLEIKSHVDKYSNIHFQPAVPMKDIVSYTASADIGIFISDITSLSYRYALPNKFFEYLHGGLPVIVSGNLEYLSGIVMGNQLGWVSQFSDVKDTVVSIQPAEVETFKNKVVDYAKDAVWETDAIQYKKIYKSFVKQERSK